MKLYTAWHGDEYLGIYSELELEQFIWPVGTYFIHINK